MSKFLSTLKLTIHIPQKLSPQGQIIVGGESWGSSCLYKRVLFIIIAKTIQKNILPSCVHRVSPQGETHHLREQRQHGCLLCLRVCVSGGGGWEPTSFGDNNRPMIFQNQVLCAFDKIILTDSHILRY